MTKKKKTVILLCAAVCVLLAVGVTAIATTNYGSADDPLITLSYLNETVKPGIQNELDTALADTKKELSADLDKKVADFTSDIDSKMSGYSGGSGSVTPTVATGAFAVVSLAENQVITCGAGSEILLRSGAATAYGGISPRLIDTTEGTSVDAAGTSLTENHMYMVPTDGHGMRAAAEVIVLVSGSYTVHDNL